MITIASTIMITWLTPAMIVGAASGSPHAEHRLARRGTERARRLDALLGDLLDAECGDAHARHHRVHDGGDDARHDTDGEDDDGGNDVHERRHRLEGVEDRTEHDLDATVAPGPHAEGDRDRDSEGVEISTCTSVSIESSHRPISPIVQSERRLRTQRAPARAPSSRPMP